MRSAVDDTIEYMKYMAPRLEFVEPSSLVTILLIQLRIPTHYDGFTYLHTAIMLRYTYPLSTMAADIYPAIRELYGDHLTDKAIDTSMRGAILTGWKRGDLTAWKRFFPTVLHLESQHPSCMEFVGELARIVELFGSFSKAYRRRKRREEATYGLS